MNAPRLVILGASGDLTARHLLRALAELSWAGALPEGLEVLGVAKEPWDDEGFRSHAARSLDLHAAEVPLPARREVVRRLRYLAGDVTDVRVARAAARGACGPVIVYLALPPSVFPPAIDALVRATLPTGSRVVVEKPFGTDLASACDLDERLHRHLPEDGIFRIDHFLGKQTVQNLLGLRFANRILEPLWCAGHIAKVEILWEESLALEGRAGYYDRTGALRDMVQSHLLQLLALVAMERPTGLDEGPLRDAKVDALRAVRPLDADAVTVHTTRARYRAGQTGSRSVPDYVDEDGVVASRRTETFADVTVFVDNDRWCGTPFRLRTGKALGTDQRAIRLWFRPVDPLPFDRRHEAEPNVLTMAFNPDRVVVDLALNGEGDPFSLDAARLRVDLASQELSAYARLLVDVFEGDVRLAIRGDEVEASWRVVQPIVDAWADDRVPLLEYVAGSPGPGFVAHAG